MGQCWVVPTGVIDAKVSLISSSTWFLQANSPTASGSVMRDSVRRCPRVCPHVILVSVVYPSRYIWSRRLQFPHTGVKSRWRTDSNSIPNNLTVRRAPTAEPRSIDGMVLTAAQSCSCVVTRALAEQKQALDGQGRASQTKLLKPWSIFHYETPFQSLSVCYSFT